MFNDYWYDITIVIIIFVVTLSHFSYVVNVDFFFITSL